MVSGNLISGAAVGVFVGGSAHGNTVETSWISADVGVHVAAGAKDNAFNDDDIYGRVGMRLEENTRTRSSKTTIDATGVGIDNAGEFHGPDTQFR
jgi:nitrous oxidase accessory protein NosD